MSLWTTALQFGSVAVLVWATFFHEDEDAKEKMGKSENNSEVDENGN